MGYMKFRLHNYRLTNLFLFVFHLSLSHFSSKKFYRDEWLQRVGPLTKGEKSSLVKFGKLLNNRIWRDNPYLGGAFFRPRLSKNEPQKIREINDLLTVLSPRFEKIWQEDRRKLLRWQEILREAVKAEKLSPLFKILAQFFGEETALKNVGVFLLSGAGNRCGGFAIPQIKGVALECSGMPYGNEERVLETLIHETAHLLYDRSNYKELLGREVIKLENSLGRKEMFGRPLEVAVNETVFTTVVNGYLGKNYLGGDLRKIAGRHFSSTLKVENFYDWILYSYLRMFEKTERYLENKRRVDKTYLDEIGSLLSKVSEGKLALS